MTVELHFHGDVLSPRLDRGSRDDDIEALEAPDEPEPSPVEEESSGGPATGKGALGAVIALAVMVVIAVAVRKFRNGDASLDD